MTKPNLFIVGAGKSGTTALHTYLSEHPQIFMSKIKEPDYFGRESLTTKDTADYFDLFSEAGDGMWVGESSTSYLRRVQAASAIHEYCPDAKIIIMLRNHPDLIYSFYWQRRMVGQEQKENFADALLPRPDKNNRTSKPALYWRLTYSQHIRRYLDHFGRENVHLIIYDDFKADTASAYAETLQFLGVDNFALPTLKVMNSRKQVRSGSMQKLALGVGLNFKTIQRIKRLKFVRVYMEKLMPDFVRNGAMNIMRKAYYSKESTPPLDQNLRHEMLNYFQSDTDELSQLIGKDLTFWYKQ